MRDADTGKGSCTGGERPAVETAGYPYEVGLRRLGTYQPAQAGFVHIAREFIPGARKTKGAAEGRATGATGEDDASVRAVRAHHLNLTHIGRIIPCSYKARSSVSFV